MLLNRKRLRWLFSIFFWTTSAYFWILPLLRPRGPYGWGHFRLLDIYLGVPLVCAALCATLYSLGQNYQKLALRIAMIITTSLLTLLIVDLFYALALHQPQQRTATDFWFIEGGVSRGDNLPDEELGFVRKPLIFWQGRASTGSTFVTYRTDEQGFRNAPGLRRADTVFIGDSFTEAASVSEENTFVQQLRLFTHRSVVNLGRGMYGPQQELIVLKRYGFSYQPKVVVWQLFEGNDLQDASRFAQWQKTPVPSETLSQRYLWHSLIARWLEQTIPGNAPVAQRLAGAHGTTPEVFLDYPYIPDEPNRDVLGFSETKAAIETGYRLCQSRGIKLLVIFVPIKARALARVVAFSDQQRQQYFPSGLTESEKDFAHQMGSYCEQINCPFVDLTPHLQRRASEDPRFVYMLNQDSHLNIDGHRAVAEIVAEWLHRKGF